MNFSLYSQYYREPRTQFNTSDHAGANCSDGFDWWLTRRAYSFQLLEQYGVGAGLVSTFKLNDILVIFRVSFSYLEMFYAFVLQFGIFLIKLEWIDELMQRESFWGRLNDQKIAGSKWIFCWQMSVIIDEFVRFYSFIVKSIWEAPIVAKSVVEFKFEH